MKDELNKILNSKDEEIELLFKDHFDVMIKEGLTHLYITLTGNSEDIEIKRQFLLVEKMHELGLTECLDEFEFFNGEYFYEV